MGVIKKDLDFIGFTFNGFHSLSDLNILRVSNGSRYEEIGSANFQDTAAEVPGKDGSYYWTSNYDKKDITLSIAYDSLTEAQFQKLKTVFNTKELCPLIFDEYPYKQYMVKLASPLQLNYICFNEGNNHRIYKGEGSLHFISYAHCGKSVYKYLNDYTNLNKEEWLESCRFYPSQGSLVDTIGTKKYHLDDLNESPITLYNPGDFETDIILYADFHPEQLTTIILNNKEVLRFKDIELNTKTLNKVNALNAKLSNVEYFIGLEINTKTHLVEEYITHKVKDNIISREKTGVLYNKFLENDTFFKIPVNASKMQYSLLEVNSGDKIITEIKYDYLYY